MRKNCIYASKYSNTGLPFFYGMKLSRLWTVIEEMAETAAEETRRRKEARKKRGS